MSITFLLVIFAMQTNVMELRHPILLKSVKKGLEDKRVQIVHAMCSVSKKNTDLLKPITQQEVDAEKTIISYVVSGHADKYLQLFRYRTKTSEVLLLALLRAILYLGHPKSKIWRSADIYQNYIYNADLSYLDGVDFYEGDTTVLRTALRNASLFWNLDQLCGKVNSNFEQHEYA